MRALLLSLLFFMCSTAGRCSSSESSEDQFSKGDGAGSSRLILNPFNIFGNPKCLYNGDEGRCYGEVECLALAGNYGAFCPGLQGLCCLFYRTCNQRTSQETSYFRNLQWPLEDQAPNACSFKVIRRADTYCGLKVEAEKVNLPPKAGSCANTYVHVTGAGNHPPMPLCGRSTGINYSIDIRRATEVSIHVNSTTRSSAAWNIKLTQIPCSEFGGATGGSGVASAPGGGSSQGGSPTTKPTAPTTTSTTTTTTPRPPKPTPHPPAPTTYSTCGIKGNAGLVRDDQPSYPRRNKQTPDVQPGNPFLKDLQYDGPNVSDSNFEYYKGPPSLINSRITFGKDSQIREYPWQVAMFVGGRYHCGASIIGDWFILTAAHCVVSYQVNPSVLRLSLGDWDVSNNQDGQYLEARVASVRQHPDYSRSSLRNDLAVLKLTKKINYSERIRPVCLPAQSIPTNGKQATVTGWGRDENKRLKSKLQYLTASITTNEDCGKRWQKKKAPANFIVNTMMCMDASNGDSCNGDSGGPSVMEIPEGSGRYTQVGIVSFGSGSCTDENLPGVYTRVSEYRDWIRQQMY